jgi:hypothetical protein
MPEQASRLTARTWLRVPCPVASRPILRLPPLPARTSTDRLRSQVGENGSSWLSHAVFRHLANVLQRSYRRQTDPIPAFDPTYAILHTRVCQDEKRPTGLRALRARASRPPQVRQSSSTRRPSLSHRSRPNTRRRPVAPVLGVFVPAWLSATQQPTPTVHSATETATPHQRAARSRHAAAHIYEHAHASWSDPIASYHFPDS